MSEGYQYMDQNEGAEAPLEYEQSESFRKAPPENNLDYNLQMVEPDWSKSEIGPELRKALTVNKSYRLIKGADGKVTVIPEQELLWSRLNAIFTKDNRLSNLTPFQERYVTYFLDLAYSFMELEGQQESAIKCVSKLASVSEPAQSRQGFLRKRGGTITTENVNKSDAPPRKGLFQQRPGGE